jgi:hypothetical protein
MLSLISYKCKRDGEKQVSIFGNDMLEKSDFDN